VVEDLTGTITVATLATTPVAIPTGMTTYGLDIVVKLDAAASSARSTFERRWAPQRLVSFIYILHRHLLTDCSGGYGQSGGYGGNGNVNGYSGYSAGNGYGGGGQGGDRMSNLGAGLKQQNWGKQLKSPSCCSTRTDNA
jgi:uncharacterized membrane protein YgcG